MAQGAEDAEPMEGVVVTAQNTTVVSPNVPWSRLQTGEEVRHEVVVNNLKWAVTFKYTHRTLKAKLDSISFKNNPCIIFFTQLKTSLYWWFEDGTENGAVSARFSKKIKRKGSFFFDPEILVLSLDSYGMPPEEARERLHIEFHLTVQKAQFFDLSKPTGPQDCMVVVWGNATENEQKVHKVYVNNAMLSIHSPFFSTFFNNRSFKEGEMKRYELRDVDFSAFKVLLHDAYGLPVSFSDQSKYQLMNEAVKLADQFQLTMTMYRFEQILMHSSIRDRFRWIHVADHHGMKALVRKICRDMTPSQAARLNQDRNMVNQFSPETVQLILNQMTKNRQTRRPNPGADSSDSEESQRGEEDIVPALVRENYGVVPRYYQLLDNQPMLGDNDLQNWAYNIAHQIDRDGIANNQLNAGQPNLPDPGLNNGPGHNNFMHNVFPNMYPQMYVNPRGRTPPYELPYGPQ